MMFKVFIKNQISKKIRIHPRIKTILWKSMRNKLSSVIFVSNCYRMFPAKCNVHNEFIRCYSKHFSCFKFFSLFNITMKCSFSMTSNSKSCITFCWSFYRIFIFFYYFTKLTLFPLIIKSFKSNRWFCHAICPPFFRSDCLMKTLFFHLKMSLPLKET